MEAHRPMTPPISLNMLSDQTGPQCLNCRIILTLVGHQVRVLGSDIGATTAAVTALCNPKSNIARGPGGIVMLNVCRAVLADLSSVMELFRTGDGSVNAESVCAEKFKLCPPLIGGGSEDGFNTGKFGGSEDYGRHGGPVPPGAGSGSQNVPPRSGHPRRERNFQRSGRDQRHYGTPKFEDQRYRSPLF